MWSQHWIQFFNNILSNNQSLVQAHMTVRLFNTYDKGTENLVLGFENSHELLLSIKTFFSLIWEAIEYIYTLIHCSNLLGHSPKALNGSGLDRQKVRARNPIQVSHVGHKDPSTWVITCCLPGFVFTGSWSKKQNQDLNQGPLMERCKCTNPLS